MKFKNYIETESGIKDTGGLPGTAGQVLSSTVTGTDWIDQKEITAGSATVVTIECKNTHTTPLTKGTPVYQTGTVGATDVIEIAPGNALVSAGAQPSIGLLQQDLAINEFGYVIITGELLNVTTDPIDGLTPVTGQKVFVKSGGGLTLTKPTTELNSIQNMGLVGKVSGGNAGSITVSSIMRTNDVPNLPTGRIWIGDGNTIVSDTVYVDEPNGRVGIGTNNPNSSLEVAGEIDSVGGDGYLVEGIPWARGNGGLLELGDWDGVGYNTSIFGANGNLAIRTQGSNVGIGTTNPGAKLDVVQSTAANGAAALHLIGPNTNPGLTSSVLIIEQGDGKKITMDGNDIDVSSGDLFINDYSLEDVTFGGQIKVKGSGSPVGNSYIANGNFGIGTTSPSQKLHVVGSGYFQNGNVFVGTTSNVMFNYISTFVIAAGSGQTIALGGGPGNVNNNVFIGNGNLYVSGNVGIGITSPSQKLHVVGRVASTAGNGFQIINSYGSPLLSDFYGTFTTTSPLYVGGPYSGQACYASAFNITSDYRLKENEAPLTEASSRIKKLKPIRFNYISSENTVDGFLAHEVAEVIPEAVTGEKDAVREDGSDELQGLDLSKIVPLLTAALQESITKIEQLEQRIQTLENK